mmetsp:Transcript_25807/g.60043  ORF Transcript_25807/g.60043 Transcript_25807/m.60043 type:complete len:222 (-) Transcript_25807:43-708(-)
MSSSLSRTFSTSWHTCALLCLRSLSMTSSSLFMKWPLMINCASKAAFLQTTSSSSVFTASKPASSSLHSVTCNPGILSSSRMAISAKGPTCVSLRRKPTMAFSLPARTAMAKVLSCCSSASGPERWSSTISGPSKCRRYESFLLLERTTTRPDFSSPIAVSGNSTPNSQWCMAVDLNSCASSLAFPFTMTRASKGQLHSATNLWTCFLNCAASIVTFSAIQ